MNIKNRRVTRTYAIASIIVPGFFCLKLHAEPRTNPADRKETVGINELVERMIYRSPRHDAASYDDISAAQQRLETQDYDSLRHPIAEVQDQLQEYGSEVKGVGHAIEGVEDKLEEIESRLDECCSVIHEIHEITQVLPETASKVEEIDFALGDPNDPGVAFGSVVSESDIDSTNTTIFGLLKGVLKTVNGLIIPE